MTSTTILKYTLLGIAEELAWLTPPWNSAEVREQRRLTKLHSKIKHKLVKLRLRSRGLGYPPKLDPLLFAQWCRFYHPDVEKATRRNRQRTTPLPLP